LPKAYDHGREDAIGSLPPVERFVQIGRIDIDDKQALIDQMPGQASSLERWGLTRSLFALLIERRLSLVFFDHAPMVVVSLLMIQRCCQELIEDGGGDGGGEGGEDLSVRKFTTTLVYHDTAAGHPFLIGTPLSSTPGSS
jgi:hypothetical protein